MHEITLKYPVTVAGQTHSKLSLRRPKQRDLENLEKRDGKTSTKSILLTADLAEVDPEVIRELDVEDAVEVAAWIEAALDPKGRRSGSPGS